MFLDLSLIRRSVVNSKKNACDIGYKNANNSFTFNVFILF